MPRVTDNEDGTKTFTINSSELQMLKSLLLPRVPDAKKVRHVIESPEFQATYEFLKSVVT